MGFIIEFIDDQFKASACRENVSQSHYCDGCRLQRLLKLRDVSSPKERRSEVKRTCDEASSIFFDQKALMQMSTIVNREPATLRPCVSSLQRQRKERLQHTR
ncbi:hypothetical protein ACJJWD_19825 [Comamonas testosteroni]|uniref:hypothetical protein n=1 Tax=Comamonas testosteroni TaxID=285 RepID=UPI003899A7A3